MSSGSSVVSELYRVSSLPSDIPALRASLSRFAPVLVCARIFIATCFALRRLPTVEHGHELYLNKSTFTDC